MRQTGLALCTALTGSLVASAASAATIAYDGFRTSNGYVDGTAVQSQTGLTAGDGFAAGAWASSNTGISYQNSAGLTYPTASYAGGGGLQMLPTSDATRTAGRTVSPTYSLPNTANYDVYASLLMRVSALDADGDAFAGFFTSATSARGLGAGVSDGNLALLVRNGSTLSYASFGQAYAADTTYQFVIKLSSGSDTWGSNDPIEAWVNPTNVSSEAQMTATALAHVSFANTYANGVSGDALSLFVNSSSFSGTTIRMDEARLGTTLADVVPEPASLGVLGPVLGMLFRRKRRA